MCLIDLANASIIVRGKCIMSHVLLQTCMCVRLPMLDQVTLVDGEEPETALVDGRSKESHFFTAYSGDMYTKSYLPLFTLAIVSL
jgi:hypothetical protein